MRSAIVASVALTCTALLACDAGPPDPGHPAIAVVAAPLSDGPASESYPFTLQGTIKVATCDAAGTLYPRSINAITIRPRGLASPSCNTAVGQGDPTCATRVVDEGADATLVNTGLVGLYRASLQRLFFTQTDPVALIGPISYGLRQNATTNFGPRVIFQGGTRDITFPPASLTVTAPSVANDPTHDSPPDGQVLDLNLHHEDMASLRLTVRFSPTRRNAGGTLDLGVDGRASERIANITISATGIGQPGVGNAPHIFRSSTRVADTGQDPSAFNAFLETSARALGDQQVIRAEIPILPNSGVFPMASYAITVALTFEDSTRIVIPIETAMAAPAACDTVVRELTVAKPATELTGSILLKPTPGFTTSPYVTSYAPLVRFLGAGGGYVRTNSTGATLYMAAIPGVTAGLDATPAAASTAKTFVWTGFDPGTYRVESRPHSSNTIGYAAGHAQLSYPGRPQFRYFTSEIPNNDIATARFGFPGIPATTVSTAAGDFATTGNFAALENAPVALTIAADMAYLQGHLELLGCITNASLSSGAAEIHGGHTVINSLSSSLRYGWSRGLFKEADSDYLIAAMAGPWLEGQYRLKLDTPNNYNGLIIIEPATRTLYDLTSNETASGADRSYATSRVSIVFNTNGQQVRKARLEIGRDTGSSSGLLANFYDPANADVLLGKYYAVSNELDTTPVVDPLVSLYALSSSRPITIRPSTEVKISDAPETWTRENRPEIQLLLTSRGSEGCDDICIQYRQDGSFSSYIDDGQGPTFATVTPSQSVVSGTTAFTLTGALNDEVPMTKVTVNGVDYPVTSVSDDAQPPTFTATFSAAVSGLVEGPNTFSIVGRGLCGNTSSSAAVVVITVDEPPCIPTAELCNGLDDDCDGFVDMTIANGSQSVCRALETFILTHPAAITGESTATFTYQNPADVDNEIFECRLDEGEWFNCNDGVWGFTGLSNGPHVFEVRSLRSDGAVDETPALYGWTIDPTVPDTFITSGPDTLTSSTTATFTFAASVEIVGVYWCALTVGEAQPTESDWAECDATTTFEGVTNGQHTLWVYAVTLAGVADPTPATWTFTVDSDQPETVITAGPDLHTTADEAAFTYEDPNDSSIDIFVCRLDGADWFACAGGTATFEGLADGQHVFEVYAINALDVADLTPARWTWTVDNAPPETTITTGPADPSQTGDGTFTFASNESEVVYFCVVTAAGATPAVNDYVLCDPTHEVQGLGEGDWTMWVYAVDTAGNADPTPASWTWTVTAELCPGDVTGPTLTCGEGLVVECVGGTAEVDVEAMAATATDACMPVTVTANAPERFVLGENTVVFTAEDGAGNTSSCAVPVTVSDTTAPVIACPGDVVLAMAADACGATMPPSQRPLSEDACWGREVTSESDAPTWFPVGETAVKAIWTDGSGNVAICRYTVTVIAGPNAQTLCTEEALIASGGGGCGGGGASDFAMALAGIVGLLALTRRRRQQG